MSGPIVQFLRKTRLCGRKAFSMAMMSLILCHSGQAAAQTQGVPARNPLITEINVFTRGEKLPLDGSTVTVTANGTPTYVSYAPEIQAFAGNKFVINGNPGIVDTVFTINEGGAGSQVSSQTITLRTNLDTGVVTATGKDSAGGTYFGATAALKADSGTATATINGGAFNLTATGNIADTTVQSCLSFTSGLKICADVFGLYSQPVIKQGSKRK